MVRFFEHYFLMLEPFDRGVRPRESQRVLSNRLDFNSAIKT